MNNPIDMIKQIIGNMQPKDVVMKMVQNNGNPMINNLIQLAQSGNIEQIKNVANNLFKEQGLDFNKEFTNFMNNFK